MALKCAVKAKILSEEEAEALGDFLATEAGTDKKLSK